MPKNELVKKEFINKELGLKVKAIENEDGSISISAEDTAIGFGWTTIAKSGNVAVRWARVNEYCKELGFDNKLAKDDYIPESLFYLLGMKANNPVAQKYQRWLAIEVIPSLRKTGSYSTKKPKQVDTKEKEIEARLINAKVRQASIYLKIADRVTIPTYKDICYSKATEALNGETLLPLPKSEKKTYSATEIGEKLGITANKVGSLANKHNLKTEEYGTTVWDKSKYSNKQVETFRYYENVIPVLEEILRQEKRGV